MNPAIIALESDSDTLDSSQLGYSILQQPGLSPAWSYHNGQNVVTLSQGLSESMNPLLKTLLAILLAVVSASIVGRMPASFRGGCSLAS